MLLLEYLSFLSEEVLRVWSLVAFIPCTVLKACAPRCWKIIKMLALISVNYLCSVTRSLRTQTSLL